MTKHVIVTFSYDHDNHIPSSVMTESIKNTVEAWGAEPVAGMSFTTPTFLNAQQCSLVEAWQALSDDERLFLRESMPQLFTAIFIAFKGVLPPNEGVPNHG